LESFEGPGRCSGRCSGGQAEIGEDLGDHGGCSMAAMMVPPHSEHCSVSISNARLRKPSLAFAVRAGVRRSKAAPGGFVSSRAQLMGTGTARRREVVSGSVSQFDARLKNHEERITKIESEYATK
jgi:hypothetical protein